MFASLRKYLYSLMKSSRDSGNDRQALRQILEQCRSYVASSEDSDWSCMGCAEIVAKLDVAIAQLENGAPVDLNELRFLFVVTGPLQETSLDNGWAQQFLVLAEQFDRAIGDGTG